MTVKKKSPIEELGGTRANVWKVEVDSLQVDPDWNVRVDYGDLEQLARSIASEGVREALTGYFNENREPIITDGHRRLKAIAIAKESYGADIKRVLFKLEPKHSNAGDRTLTMLSSNSGKSLTPYEIGAVVKRLLNYGWTPAEISKRSGYCPTYLTRCELLSNAPACIKKLIFDEKSISQTTALNAIEKHGLDGALPVLKEAIGQAKSNGKSKATGKLVKTVGEAAEKAKLPETERLSLIARICDADWGQVSDQQLLKVSNMLNKHQIPER